jgi:hypothetical protein
VIDDLEAPSKGAGRGRTSVWGQHNRRETPILRGVDGDRSGRQTEFCEDGTLVTTHYDRRGRIVKQTYYWSRDQELLMRILASLRQPPEPR